MIQALNTAFEDEAKKKKKKKRFLKDEAFCNLLAIFSIIPVAREGLLRSSSGASLFSCNMY